MQVSAWVATIASFELPFGSGACAGRNERSAAQFACPFLDSLTLHVSRRGTLEPIDTLSATSGFEAGRLAIHSPCNLFALMPHTS